MKYPCFYSCMGVIPGYGELVSTIGIPSYFSETRTIRIVTEPSMKYW